MARLFFNSLFATLAACVELATLSDCSSLVAAAPDFERDIRPILERHCFECHSGKAKKGNLALGSIGDLVHGGQSGPAIVAGAAGKSLLVGMIADGSMPPDGRPSLSTAEANLLAMWVDSLSANELKDVAVAPQLSDDDRNYWAFCKAQMPQVPQNRQAEDAHTPIDAFVLKKLEDAGLAFSPEAGKRTLLRRVHFDLLGLPPSQAEMDAYLSDPSPDAYERLVDRLLASPHYGERWGRHYLDAAGYADTVKTDNDINGSVVRDGIWRYRDYVVRSLNADKPYDQFVREQLAGDEMLDINALHEFPAEAITPEMQELLIATGMLRISVDGTNNFERNRPLERFELLFDTIENLSSNLLGLTVSCARCHDHKFDPISQRDYYGLMACLTPAYNPDAWLQPQKRHILISTEAEIAEINAYNKDLDRRAGELGGQAAKLVRPMQDRLFDERLGMLPEAIREDVRSALKTPANKRSEVQKYLFEKFDAHLKVSRDAAVSALSAEERTTVAGLDRQVEDLRARKRTPQKIQAIFDIGIPPATHLLQRGNYETPGPEVAAAVPAVLAETLQSREVGGDREGSSGRRLGVALALTQPDSRAAALLARVAVNRVWQHHFGRGIVATPSNLGRSGESPTHPELLEWLTADFIAGGWKFKRLHQQIVLSRVYRQTSHLSAATAALAYEVDPDNRLLSRMPLVRLESEAIRDAILSVSGTLDPSIGGPPVLVEGQPDGQVVVTHKGLESPTSPWRRSLYLLARRNFHLSFLAVFDQPMMGTNCGRRSQSAVVSQSLTMLNDEFVAMQAELFARRLIAAVGPDQDQQIRHAFHLALSREPSEVEIHWSRDLLARSDLASLCQMLLNTNEFLYVE